VGAVSRRTFLGATGVATIGALTMPASAAQGARKKPKSKPDASGTATTFEGHVNDRGGQVFNVTNPAYGAKRDTVRSLDSGAMVAGSTTFTQTAPGTGGTSSETQIRFDAATDLGKVLTVHGAGPSGGLLSTRIIAVVDTSSVTVADAASTSVTNAVFTYGSDDTAAIVAVIAAAGDTGTVFLPGGIYTILGASNGGQPILHDGRGGILGCGGKLVPSFDAFWMSNSVLLCCDATAGLVANGCARYESFMCDGNHIATTPLQNGIVANNTVATAGSNATFIDVWARLAANTGWAIYGARENTYYDCGSCDNRREGLHIDGGAEGLDFFHFHERGNPGYGIHGDDLIAAVGGATAPTRRIRFYSGLCDGAAGAPPRGPKLYLRNAEDWRFPEMIFVGLGDEGATIDLDQSQGSGIDLSDCWVFAPSRNTNPGFACIEVNGNAPPDATGMFLKTDGCHFTQADNSVSVKGDKGGYTYAAVDGWWDETKFGPVAAAGLPAVDTLFAGRTGGWQTAAVLAPWSGNVTYRFMGEGWVECRGTAQYSGTGSGPLFTLPMGYRPDGSTRRLPVVASSGAGVLTITTGGDVVPSPVGLAAFPANTTVYLDGAKFPVGG
jgi:hypothetical protein